MLILQLSACGAKGGEGKIKIKALLLTKFELGELTVDSVGEARLLYDKYCAGGEEYDIAGGFEGNKLFLKNGVALYITGMGKVNAALSVAALLNDSRFDFSESYVISTGCAGAAYGYGVMGDVFVISAMVDYDLGHHVDMRDIPEDADNSVAWYRDNSFDAYAFKLLDPELTQRVYGTVKDVKLSTTELTRRVMASSFDNASWAMREPMVLKGSSATADNYWKGMHSHNKAEYIVKSYACPDPYAVSEMEDIAIAIALERANMLDRYIVIRTAVNMDVFTNGDTAVSLWDPDSGENAHLNSSSESVDIFQTAMENCFLVTSRLVDAILGGSL